MWDEARGLLLIEAGGGPAARALSRMVASGTHLRLRPGVYAERAIWSRLTSDERLQLRMVALVATSRTRPVFSHWAAGLLLGLPVARRATDAVDVIVDATRFRGVVGVRAHLLLLDASEVVEIEGMLCTSLLRTAVDVAADGGFEEAVVLADVVLRRAGTAARALAHEALEACGRRRGLAKVAKVLAFADGRSGSPGESISRVRIDRAGFVRPELQVEIVVDGVSYWDDFDWEEVLGAGEFDGELKYREDRYRQGGSAADVVIREKNRENRMRTKRPRFARWDWADLMDGRLESILRAVGIPKHGGNRERSA